MGIITLDNSQKEIAEGILDRISEGVIEHPNDVVDSWVSAHDSYDYREIVRTIEEELPRTHHYVPVARIAGTTKKRTDYLQLNRLERVLTWLIEGNFDNKRDSLPKLEKLGEKYYVSVDGNHRILAFRALGLEEIYAETIELPIT